MGIDFDEVFSEVEEEMSQEQQSEPEENTDNAEEVQDLDSEQETENEESSSETENEEEVQTQQAQSKEAIGFARLRKAKEAAEKELQTYKGKLAFFENLATQNGMTVDQLIEQYQQAIFERESKTKNIPVEYLKNQKALEDKTKQLESVIKGMTEQQQSAMFNQAYAEFLKEIPLSEEETNKFFESAVQKGFNLLNTPTPEAMKMAYYTLNPDKFTELTRQKILQKQKKDQRRAPVVPSGSSSSSKTSQESVQEDEWMKKFFEDTPYASKMKPKK